MAEKIPVRPQHTLFHAAGVGKWEQLFVPCCPHCRPSKARPSRNEPALLPHVLRAMSRATGRSEEEVALQTTRVACAVFGIQLPA